MKYNLSINLRLNLKLGKSQTPPPQQNNFFGVKFDKFWLCKTFEQKSGVRFAFAGVFYTRKRSRCGEILKKVFLCGSSGSQRHVCFFGIFKFWRFQSGRIFLVFQKLVFICRNWKLTFSIFGCFRFVLHKLMFFFVF